MDNQDEFTTALSFKHDMIFYARQNWPIFAGKLNEMFRLSPPLPINDHASFDFFLALLFVQSRAPYNIYNYEQGERIWKYLKNTFAVEPQYGSYANESLDLYLSAWELHSKDGHNPVGAVVSVFLYKLGAEEAGNILLGELLMDTFMMAPPWWKNYSDKNRLVRSDAPVDLEAFQMFCGVSLQSHNSEVNLKGKPDGAYQYRDAEGKTREGWLPPDQIADLMKILGAKKLTRVLIKGTWDGVKEDFWDIENETIEKFADDEGIVHVTCYFENGVPKYRYLLKRLWINLERIEEIVRNPHLSSEEKKDQIDKLK